MEWDDLSPTPPQQAQGSAAPQSSDNADEPSWDDLSPAPPRTWGQEIGRDVRQFARGVIPSTAGLLAGAAVGTAATPFITPVGGFAAGAAAGLATAAGAQATQDKLADALGIDSPEQRAADARDPNAGSIVAGAAPALIALSPGGLATTLGRRVAMGGLMGAVDIGQQAVTKGPSNVDPLEAAVQAGVGAALPNLRPWAQGIVGGPHAPMPSPAGPRADANVNAPTRTPEENAAAVHTPPATSPALGNAYVHAAPAEAKMVPAGTPEGGFAATQTTRDTAQGFNEKKGRPAATQEGVQTTVSPPGGIIKGDTDPALQAALDGQVAGKTNLPPQGKNPQDITPQPVNHDITPEPVGHDITPEAIQPVELPPWEALSPEPPQPRPGTNQEATPSSQNVPTSADQFRDVKTGSGATIMQTPSQARPVLFGKPLDVPDHVAQVLRDPGIVKAIEQGGVNRKNHVPYEAGASSDSDVTNIDKRIPGKALLPDGKNFPTAPPMQIHEQVEKPVMQRLIAGGMEPSAAYKVAHWEYAQPTEDAWYAANGIDPKAADKWWQQQAAVVQKAKIKNVPANLYDKPYPHDSISLAQEGSTATAKPTAEELAQAQKILGGAQQQKLGGITDRPDAPIPDWVKANNASAVQAAKQLKLTDTIGNLARQGKTAAEISEAIGGKLDPASVRAVRDSLGIKGGPQGSIAMGRMPESENPAEGMPTMQAMARPRGFPGKQGQAKLATDLAAATKKIEDQIGDKVKTLPPGAQKIVDAADERIGRVPLRSRNAFSNWINQTWFGKVLNPQGIDDTGEFARRQLRSNLGEIQERYDKVDAALTQNIRDFVGALSPEQQHELQRAMQDPNPMERLAKFPEAEPFVRTVRQIMKDDADFKMKKGTLDAEQIERDHFPQLWENPKAAEQFLDSWYARQGSKGGFKQKIHPTIADGEASGLKLRYANPIDVIASRMRTDYRYQMLNSMLEEAMQAGIVHSEALPGDMPINAEINGMKGRKFYAPEGYATVFNNHFSPGWRDSPAGKQFMDLAQPATAWSRSLLLGLSPFHGITMVNEAFISQMKLGLQTMARDPVEGAKIIAKSPFGAKALYSVGKQAQKAAIGQDMGEDFSKTVPLLRKANARFYGDTGSTFEFNPGGETKSLSPAPAESIMQSFSNGLKEAKNDIKTNFKAANGQPLEIGKATLKSIGTAMQAFSHPLFNQIIPTMKIGAMHMELGEWLRQQPEATDAQQHDMAMRIADDVDNRFGLMTHDNLFWNNKLKEGMQIGMTSPTWTVGFMRNFAGGLARGAMNPSRAFMGSKNYDPNISSAITLGMAVAITSGVYQYLKTGKPPSSVYDLMAGQTGGKTKAGQPERAILPGFQKDVYGYFHDPVGEAYNKIGPLPRTIIEAAINKGWVQTSKGPRYGLVSNPNDPFWKQVVDRAQHTLTSMAPITVQQLTKKTEPTSNISTSERAAAIREAPKYINPGGNPREHKAFQRDYKFTHPEARAR